MASERSRGRPGRNADDVAGREKLLAAARAFMREKSPVRLHRKQIAQAAGLAPALVTYYFQDEASLIEAAARPIIDHYLLRLKTTLENLDQPHQTLRDLVLLLLEIGRENGQLLDAYITYMKQNNVPHKTDILTGSYAEIDRFFRHSEQQGFFRSSNPAFMSSALWGICKTIAQLPELALMLQQGQPLGDRDIMALQADMVVELMVNALAPPRNPD